MTREAGKTFVIAALLAFFVGFSGAACLVTGFDFETVNLGAALLLCAAYSTCAVWCFTRKRGGWLLAGVWVAGLMYLWLTDRLSPEVEAFLYRISSGYNSAYRCGTIRWSDLDITQVSPAAGVHLIACLAITPAAWTLSRRKPAIWAVIFGFLPLIVCLVVTNTVPEEWCLFILLSSMVLLMVTNTVRRRSERDGNRLTAMLLIPVLLGANLLFWTAPRDGYVVGSDNFQQSLLSWVQKLPFAQFQGGGGLHLGVGTHGEEVNLSTLGPNRQTQEKVMEVTSSRDGVLYLREQSYDTYTGKSWSITEVSTGKDTGWPDTGVSIAGRVEIHTLSDLPRRYVPYYPGATLYSVHFTNGSVSNPDRIRNYTLAMLRHSTYQNVPYAVNDGYLYLPEDTRALAQTHLAAMELDANDAAATRAAEQIKEYVRNAARYDLDTGKMPSGENDFAMWFLNESDTGYCVHFASAAAVLLRAAGIPARYVTGYIVNARENELTVVTADKSHAWVEYLDPAKGWTILDATPSEGLPGELLPTETTIPGETTEPAETTQPTETQGPDHTLPTIHNTEPSDEVTLPDVTSPVDTPEKEVDLSGLWATLKWLSILLGVCAAVAGQYSLRLRLRKKKMRTGPSNHRALAQWREVLRYARLLKKKPPEELLQLAEKAKFSQHSLTDSERSAFDDYLVICKAGLAKKPLLLRFLIRLIFAIE